MSVCHYHTAFSTVALSFEIRKCETVNFFSRLFWLFRYLLRLHINASISAKDIGIFDRGYTESVNG